LKEITMTQLLEKAIKKANTLPSHEQDVLASILLDEIASEQSWSASFAKSQDVLTALADEALAEHASITTQNRNGVTS
jgi:hypothetical protein